MVYVTSKSLARFLDKIGTSSFFRNHFLLQKQLLFTERIPYLF